MARTTNPQYVTKQDLAAFKAEILAALGGQSSVVAPEPKAPKAQPKAEPKFRTAKQLSSGNEQAREIWAAHYAAAGVKRFKDLTPAQQKAAKAEVSAMWKAIEGTRKTKVA